MATNPIPAPPPTIPEVVYAIFCGPIDQSTAQKTVNSLTIAIYNLFRSMTIELTLYNVGQISSAGVVAYLGAKRRKTSKAATFMLHRSTNSPQFATSTTLDRVAKSLVLDDERTESIVRNHVTFPPKLWAQLKHQDIYLSGEHAVKFGLADEVAEFAPPAGIQVFNLLA